MSASNPWMRSNQSAPKSTSIPATPSTQGYKKNQVGAGKKKVQSRLTTFFTPKPKLVQPVTPATDDNVFAVPKVTHRKAGGEIGASLNGASSSGLAESADRQQEHPGSVDTSSTGNPFISTTVEKTAVVDNPVVNPLPSPKTESKFASLSNGSRKRDRPEATVVKGNRLIDSDDSEDEPAVRRKKIYRRPSQRLASPELSSGDSELEAELLDSIGKDLTAQASSRKASTATALENLAHRNGASSDAPSRPSRSNGVDDARKALMVTEDDKRQQRKQQFDDANERKYEFLRDPKDAEQRRPGEEGYDPKTLHVPASAWKAFTPFEKQFWAIKKDLMDTLVFFKKGKFFELYERDADLGHQLYDLKITGRSAMRMVGVPETSFLMWASKFIAQGYKVAKVDQTETAIGKTMRERENGSKKEKIIGRELKCILTSGTAIDPEFIPSDHSNYCLAIFEEQGVKGPVFGIALVDASVAGFEVCEIDQDVNRSQLETLLVQTRPREVVHMRDGLTPETRAVIRKVIPNSDMNPLPESAFPSASEVMENLKKEDYFKGGDLPALLPRLFRQGSDSALSALGGLVAYLKSLMIERDLVSANNFEEYDPHKTESALVLDGQTLDNLDVLRNANNGGSAKGTLSELLNRCVTPFGRRMFEKWLAHPLKSPLELNERLDVVDELMNDQGLSQRISTSLKVLPDVERIIARVFGGSCRVRDFQSMLLGLEGIFACFQGIRKDFPSFKSKKLDLLIHDFGTAGEKLTFFKDSYTFDFTQTRDGTVIPHPGVEEEYDDVLERLENIKEDFAQHLDKQRKALRCSKLVYKDLGKEHYQIEVPNSIQVPKDWQRKSSTKAVTRYHSPFLITKTQQLAELEEIQAQLVSSSKNRMYARFNECHAEFRKVVDSLAELDCLVNLAVVSANLVTLGGETSRPVFVDGAEPRLVFKSLRHPLLAAASKSCTSVIPNDIHLGAGQPKGHNFALLTGPNMGGKSTLLRQVCVAVIMAQIGCHVPAAYCEISIFDRIFTRIGAHDNIMAGLSTFMVELSETSAILDHATDRSLVILDELGRGTSTFDGYAIAYSVVHELSTRIRCLGLFSTHYAGLTTEFEVAPRIGMYFMDSHLDEESREITFLYKFVEGVCPQSFGMNVARLAGMPVSIVDRAHEVAQEFERTSGSVEIAKSSKLLQSTIYESTGNPNIAALSRQDLASIASTMRVLWQTSRSITSTV